MTPAQQIHAAALALISDPDRWTQGTYARTQYGDSVDGDDSAAVCWCSAGAIEAVAYNCSRTAKAPVIEALHAAAASDNSMHYVDFNDRHTHEEVMAMWQRAGEILATQ